MAAGKFTLYTAAKLSLPTGGIDLDTDTLVGTVHTGYTPSAAHSTWADVSATEATGTGYTPGGQVLSGVTTGTANGLAYIAFTALSWANATLAGRHVIVTKRASGSLVSGDKLVGYLDLTGAADMSSTNGTFSVTFGGPAWAISTAYAAGDTVTAAGNTYRATTGGTSASSGSGPTGTTGAITDNFVTWQYIGPAGVIVTLS